VTQHHEFLGQCGRPRFRVVLGWLNSTHHAKHVGPFGVRFDACVNTPSELYRHTCSLALYVKSNAYLSIYSPHLAAGHCSARPVALGEAKAASSWTRGLVRRSRRAKRLILELSERLSVRGPAGRRVPRALVLPRETCGGALGAGPGSPQARLWLGLHGTEHRPRRVGTLARSPVLLGKFSSGQSRELAVRDELDK
jgi:hypothetical protein